MLNIWESSAVNPQMRFDVNYIGGKLSLYFPMDTFIHLATGACF